MTDWTDDRRDNLPRVKVLRLHPQAIVRMLKSMDGTGGNGIATCHGLPADARAVGVRLPYGGSQELGIVIESEEYEPLREYAEMEWVNLEFSMLFSEKIVKAVSEAKEELGT